MQLRLAGCFLSGIVRKFSEGKVFVIETLCVKEFFSV